MPGYDIYVRDTRILFDHYTEPLKGKTIDYAMLPLDPRFKDVAYLTVKRYIEIADIRFWSPMHLWGKYDFTDIILKESSVVCRKHDRKIPVGRDKAEDRGRQQI
ncbi:MAG: hypothetical protein K5886_04270 [Lachnospiraceae bacterium]|nr:hypothetical protein [Lachnospiraceae bacterium]